MAEREVDIGSCGHVGRRAHNRGRCLYLASVRKTGLRCWVTTAVLVVASSLPIAPAAPRGAAAAPLPAHHQANTTSSTNTSAAPLERVVSGAAYHFEAPDALAVSNGDLFVANGAGNSLTELNASTGALVRVVSGPAYEFSVPDAMAVSGHDLFVANNGGAIWRSRTGVAR